jgi:F0F1-type ATP synthase delta subunit
MSQEDFLLVVSGYVLCAIVAIWLFVIKKPKPKQLTAKEALELKELRSLINEIVECDDQHVAHFIKSWIKNRVCEIIQETKELP